MSTTATKRITIATVKSFIKKNRAALLLNVKSSFDGMQDMVDDVADSSFAAAEAKTGWDVEQNRFVPRDQNCKYSLGIMGVWFCGGGADTCTPFEDEQHIGFEVYNCCGCWIVAVAK